MVTFPDQITDRMLEAKDLLSSKMDSIANKTQKWEERQATINESWAESRSVLWENLLKWSFADANKCMKCLEEPAVIRCNKCSATKYLCGPCEQYVHILAPLHDSISSSIAPLYCYKQLSKNYCVTSLLGPSTRNVTSYVLFFRCWRLGNFLDRVCLYNPFILCAIGLVLPSPVAVLFLKQFNVSLFGFL